MTNTNDTDLPAANRRTSDTPPLLRTLNELNNIQIAEIEQHVDRLWHDLQANFNNTNDATITGDTKFIFWAFQNVDRQTLCRILDKKHKDDLQLITTDIQRRLANLCPHWDASPGLFFACFGQEITRSRRCIDLLKKLRGTSPQLSLGDFIDCFNRIPRNNDHRYGLRSVKNQVSVFKLAVGECTSFAHRTPTAFAHTFALFPVEPTLVMRQQRYAKDRPPPESDSSSNSGDSDNDLADNSNLNKHTSNDGGKKKQDARRPLPAGPPFINTRSTRGERSSPSLTRKRSPATQHVDATPSPEQSRRERQASSVAPKGPVLVFQSKSNLGLHNSSLQAGPSTHDADDGGDDNSLVHQSIPRAAYLPQLTPSPFGPRNQDTPIPPQRKRARLGEARHRDWDVSNGSFGDVSFPPLERDGAATPMMEEPTFLPPARSDLPSSPVLITIKSEESPVLPPLKTSPAGATIEANLERRSSRLKYRCSIPKISGDMHRLLPGQKLNDTIINALLNRLTSVTGKVLAIDSFVLDSKNIPDRVYNEIQHGEQHKLLMPVCNDDHWVLFVFFCQEHKVRLFDSCPGVLHAEKVCRDVILPFLRRIGASDDVQVDLDVSGCARQNNNIDCGLFTLLFAYQVSGTGTSMPTDVTSKTLDEHRLHFLQCLLTSTEAALSPKEAGYLDELGETTSDRSTALARLALEVWDRQFSYQSLLKPSDFFDQSMTRLRQLHQAEARRWETLCITSALGLTHVSHGKLLRNAVQMECERRERRKEMDRRNHLQAAVRSILINIPLEHPVGSSVARSKPASNLELSAMLSLRSATEVAAAFLTEGNLKASTNDDYNPFTICVAYIVVARFIRQRLSSIEHGLEIEIGRGVDRDILVVTGR
ncbi:Ulp1 protease family protein [Colletotrichum limetticola]|uniref:Ulp1 protease family protein n=1 Tax=Colletotrichum limetticola TaxID=1209924 RepID=A0ABQ9PJZ5_9PEZI|nr:Ulp1 protease family protein [Colletotrichum limetticola]